MRQVQYTGEGGQGTDVRCMYVQYFQVGNFIHDLTRAFWNNLLLAGCVYVGATSTYPTAGWAGITVLYWYVLLSNWPSSDGSAY